MELEITQVSCLLWLDEEAFDKIEKFEEDLWEFLNNDLISDKLEITDNGLVFDACDKWHADQIHGKIIEWMILVDEYKKFRYEHPELEGGHFNPLLFVPRSLVKRVD